MPDALVVIPVYNEKDAIGPVLLGLRRLARNGFDVVFVDDASDDGTEVILKHTEFQTLRHESNLGCGQAVRTGIAHGLAKGHECIAVMAGNGRDDPASLPAMVRPVIEGEADLVQGSRYLKGATCKDMPIHRIVGTRWYSLLSSILLRKWLTDATNGFRAIRTGVLSDPKLNLDQAWLRTFDVEPYILAKAILLGYRVKEMPVSKNYAEGTGRRNPNAFSGWWSHFRPIPMLALGLKH